MTQEQWGQRAFTYSGWLIVTACLWALLYQVQQSRRYEQPRGVAVVLLRSCTRTEEDNRGDSREVWVRLRNDGGTLINERKVDSNTLRSAIEQEMSTRWEKVTYLSGDSDISYQRLAEVAADLQQGVPDMYIFLPTDSNLHPKFPCLLPAGPIQLRFDRPRSGSLSQRH